jgi:hypothetical protein
MPPETEEQPQDLRAMLSRAVDESETPAAATETPERPERQVRDIAALAESGGTEPIAATDDRPRGPDGKFLPKEGAQEDKSGDLAAETGHETGAAEEPAPPAEATAEVPAHWSQSDKDMIAGLPKEHQGKVVERYKAIEAGYAPKLQRAAQIEQEYRGAMEIFEPHMRGLRQAGKTPSDIIRGWHSIEQDMIQGREYAARGGVNDMGAQHVARMIAAYNIDPGRVAALLRGEQPEGNMGAGAQPPPAAIPQQFLQAFNSLEQRLNQREAADQAAKEAAVNSQMDTFINEKDETGQLKHPYFSELERDMTMLAQTMLSQGMQPTIADLYQRAVYANPETRSKLLAANQAQEQRKAAAERKAKADAATRAASSVNGSPGTGGSPAERRGARTLREQIAEAAAELEAG